MANDYDYQNERESQYSRTVSDKLTYLLVGGGIGAVLALLFAPKSGNELRGDIADATRKGYDKTREYGQQLQQKSEGYITNAKQKAGDVYTRAGGAINAARSELTKQNDSQSIEGINSPQIGKNANDDFRTSLNSAKNTENRNDENKPNVSSI